MNTLHKIYHSLINLQYQAGLGRYSKRLLKNASLKNAASNVKRCFILATGPSIRTQDLSPLHDEFCISVSNFFVHPSFKQLNPRFHIFAGWHPPITHEQIGEWWLDATEHLRDTRTKVFINARDEELREKYNAFSSHQVFHYYEGGGFPVNFTKQIPAIQTVVHVAIYLAMYMGIQEIYLLGCDHSWILHHGKSMHFYQEEEHSFTKSNYSEWSQVKDIGEEFISHARLWDVYRKIRTESLKKQVRIYNATPGSLLDIFPRVELTDVIKALRNA